MNFRKKFGGITITQVELPTEYKGSYWHQKKTPEPPMYAWVYPVCLREQKDEPQVERKDLPQLPVPIYSASPTPIQEVQSGRSKDEKAQITGGSTRRSTGRSTGGSSGAIRGKRSKSKRIRRKR